MNAVNYDRWIWIELIGFDNRESDYGVSAYLKNAAFIPDGISLLLFTPDFVHAHKGMEKEHTLPIEICSYAARPYGKHHNRQEWTNYQLRGLVEELQKHRIDVYCSFFNLFHFQDNGQDKTSEWCSKHPELYEMRKTGEAFPVINPLKRMKDGSYYEDLFVADLVTVMRDYNFDGYHGADGYTSPRLTIAEADYSDDMVEQFTRFSGVELAESLKLICDGEPLEMEKRGDWIWTHKRMEWINFCANRWGELWQKIMPALRKEGKKAVLNSVWTRDPFEALHRYGVDYKLLAASGVDAFVIESVAASMSAGAGEIEYEPGTEFKAMIMTIKAHVPDMKLICLNAIQDTNEQWDAISHAPTLLERDIYSFSNLFMKDQQGVHRCTSGFVACLGDGISVSGWEWIMNRWNLGYEGQPERIIGTSFVWADEALYPSLERYPATRNWPAFKYLMAFIDRGAPLHTMVNVKDLQHTSGAICVTDLHLLPDQALQQVLAYRNGSSTLVGHMTERIAQAFAGIGMNVKAAPDELFCMAREANGTVIHTIVQTKESNAMDNECEDLTHVVDPGSWVDPLYFSPVPDDFLNGCVQAMINCSDAPLMIRNEQYIRTTTLEINAGKWRILIQNLHLNYKSAHLDVGRPVAKVSVLTDFPGIPVFPDGSNFKLYVPGRGMVVVEVDF
ncbi:hypothetical protein [Paenibacillus paridis]|uniref:hypothetical protein n=1 Tax=Paenibacillus paridis TaxID=2583376 RepID=UPI00111EAFB0|nr:hypothetical protein [Paenibacillus paridis]